jgi:hypothetical protein
MVQLRKDMEQKQKELKEGTGVQPKPTDYGDGNLSRHLDGGH